jgi:hypothetical protein
MHRRKTKLLTRWSGVLVKLIVKKFPTFYGTRMFVTNFYKWHRKMLQKLFIFGIFQHHIMLGIKNNLEDERESFLCPHHEGVWRRRIVSPLILNLGPRRT